MRLVTTLLLLLPVLLSAQIMEVREDGDVVRLVREIFASGECETITNIRRIGNGQGNIGSFVRADSTLGFSEGILFSTGEVRSAPGPNISTRTSTIHATSPVRDADLSNAATDEIYDQSGVEFDFVPLQPTISFRYVFASEEYCEFVGADFNDIFGFFVSGPGIDGDFSRGAVNLARVPGTDDEVSINNVNFRRNSAFYLDNEFPSIRDFADCGGGDAHGPRQRLIEFDGQTVILTATIDVEVCATYHIRLVVADVGDGELDSAVFLEAGSFDLGGEVTLEGEGQDGQPPLVFEGCAPTPIRIQRGPTSDIRNDQIIRYRVGDNSVATPGTDFTVGDGEITIPAGDSSAVLNLTALADATVEGPESVWLYLDIPCACYTDSIELTITEPAPLEVGLAEAYYCPDQTVRLEPAVSGGSGAYAYDWSFGSTDPNPELTPPLPTSLSLTVTDECGQTASRTIPTFSSEPPGFALPPQDLEACRDEALTLAADLTGRPPFTLTYQRGSEPPATLTSGVAGRVSWPLPLGGNYRLISLSDLACSIPLDTSLRVRYHQPSINPRITSPTCAGSADGRIEVTHLPTVPPYTYDWTGLTVAGLTADNVGAGQYALRVTDALGCTDFRELEVRGPAPLLPVDISCVEVRRPPLRPSADGGTPPYEYSVDGVNYWPGEEFDRRLSVGEFYRLRVRDASGCALVQEDFFWPRAIGRTARLPTFVPQELAGSSAVDPEYFIPPEQIVAYRWYPAELFDCPTCPSPVVSAPNTQPISLAFDDLYGCTDTLVTIVAVDGRVPVYVPTAFSPNGDGRNDFVAVFANPLQVERILSFTVADRWGEILYTDADFPPNVAARGWDGTLNGRLMKNGVYAWIAEVLLTTGETQRESGTVILMPGG